MSNVSVKQSRERINIKRIFFLILSVVLPILIIYLGIAHPYFSYNGDKNIPKDVTVHFNGLTFRDLGM